MAGPKQVSVQSAVLRERVVQALAFAVAAVSASWLAPDAWAWTVDAAVAVTGVSWIASTAAQVALLADLSRGDGEMLLVSGQRVRARTLVVGYRLAIAEALLVLALATAAMVASILGERWWPIAPNLAVAFVQIALFAARVNALRVQSAHRALRERKPTVALARLRGDLSPPHRAHEALLAANAHAMLGQIDEALERLAPHVGPSTLARFEDAELRLGQGDPRPARDAIANATPNGAWEEMRKDLLAAELALEEGRAAEVVAAEAAWMARVAGVPPEHGDGVRLVLAAAAADAGLPDAGDRLAGLSRPLDDFAFLARSQPRQWALVEKAAGRRVAAPVPRVQRPDDQPYAPPATDEPAWTGAAARRRFEGPEPTPDLRLGIRRSQAMRIVTLVLAAFAVMMVVPALVFLPLALLVDTSREALGAIVLVLGAVALALEAVAREALRLRPGAPPYVILDDGGRVGLVSFRVLAVLRTVERFGLGAYLAALTLAVLGPLDVAGWAGPLLAALVVSGGRSYDRARRLTLLAHDHRHADAVVLARRWQRSWLVPPIVKGPVATQLALELLALGDVPAASAAVNGAPGVEARWCSAWCAVAEGRADAVRHLARTDGPKFWRLGLRAWLAFADTDPARVIAEADAYRELGKDWPNRYGELARVWLAVALASSGQIESARKEVEGVELSKHAWVGVFPGVSGAWVRLESHFSNTENTEDTETSG